MLYLTNKTHTLRSLIWKKTLSVNAGSSSLKWQLYEMPEEKVIAKGIFERIGLPDSVATAKIDGQAHVRKQKNC